MPRTTITIYHSAPTPTPSKVYGLSVADQRGCSVTFVGYAWPPHQTVEIEIDSNDAANPGGFQVPAHTDSRGDFLASFDAAYVPDVRSFDAQGLEQTGNGFLISNRVYWRC